MSEPDGRTEAIKAYTELIRQVFRLNGQLIAHGDDMARGASLTAARWQVLGALAAKPETVAQLAREMEITRQSVQRTVNWVVEAGLAELIDNPSHRRARLVRLTRAGEAARAGLRPVQTAWAAQVVAGFDGAELVQALSVLSRLRQRLETMTDPAREGASTPAGDTAERPAARDAQQGRLPMA